jgi:hypothetical protein
MKMTIRKAICFLILLTLVAIQPALAAGAPAAKPAPAVESLQLANVPMKSLTADDDSATAIQTTPRDDVGFRVEELFEAKACPTGGNATFTWTIVDGCADGVGLYVRFFDETNNIVFPNSSQVYSVNSGRSGVVRLSVKRGAKICYGAEPSDRDGTYWGVSIDNNQSCATCCNIVPNTGNISRSVRLVCN